MSLGINKFSLYSSTEPLSGPDCDLWPWHSSSMSPQICMGMCLHQDVSEESKKAKLQSSKIEQDLCEHARTEMNVVKILLLGRCSHSETPLLSSCWYPVTSVGLVYVRTCGKWEEHPDQTD